MYCQRNFLARLFLCFVFYSNGLQHDIPRDKRYVENKNGITNNVFEHARTDTKLSFITNSGICETTPGVNQYSGYLTVNETLNMFFWFFESRNSPTTSPLVMWFNGGPGCSSMIGLFVENGPCHFVDGNPDPVINPFSWNTVANMLYIDQPGETGFSYGSNTISSTQNASTILWTFMQVFYDAFPQYYLNRNFSLFTESYGGHFGPQFALDFLNKNDLIDKGLLTGSRKINLVSLAINNAWLDPVTQYKSYLDFALNNTYRQLINQPDYVKGIAKYEKDCYPIIQECTSTTGSAEDCAGASGNCYEATAWLVEEMNLDKTFNQYDIRLSAEDTVPPNIYEEYLNRKEVKQAIGVPGEMGFVACLGSINDRFLEEGDQARSFLGELGEVVQAGVRVLLWAGDADWICNWMGNLKVAEGVEFEGREMFLREEVGLFTVGGKVYGEFKGVDGLSWLRVYDSGHMV
ncbi:Alpha/Beta hydrolase protein [Podospora fimiseda]|uniref:Carboxypeptidase n=1 Tax=Podospora fimiseda TaxID=252190 RepID=A0AAN7BI21_9PEZI|nr:Alpha/Beta hydrolase protein [Podospora fimiseda]